ncbi:VanZ family protein [Halapricum hydrolyticum]|uniref:VanZ family protein n=1 Tax=Halapricum hydrolyticum TaxID=2979991 RepID=A0AAE3IB78_9EURY|nr:VanZ family protein [Halapricum hydrolyticum]MCU4717793.1 VanZ family protein [Halapricum hydrolyticum]MCU4726957.1 VanZ family protein [Halapricum hydrolyticum]
MSSSRSRRLALVALVILVSAIVPTGGAVARTGPFGLGLDLWLHALAYAVLEATVLAAIVGSPDASLPTGALSIPATLPVVTAYGLVIEGVQLLVPYRHASVADALANAVGAGVMLVGWFLYVHLR